MTKTTSERPATAVITSNGKLRFSYMNVFEPRAMEGGEAKYSVCILIDKTDAVNLNLLRSAIAAATNLGKENGKYGQKPVNSPAFKNPLRDGDAERPDDEAYQGCYFVNANNSKPVGVIGPNAKKITALEQDTIYSGCYGNAAVNFFPFNFNGTIGVGCGLNAIQKVSDGERLSGFPDPESLFTSTVEGAGDDSLL